MKNYFTTKNDPLIDSIKQVLNIEEGASGMKFGPTLKSGARKPAPEPEVQTGTPQDRLKSATSDIIAKIRADKVNKTQESKEKKTSGKDIIDTTPSIDDRRRINEGEDFVNIGGAKVKNNEKDILTHIKKTFPNVKKVKHDSQHGWIPVFEENMTDAQKAKREEIVKSMKKNKSEFVKNYGKDAENVMYATATKQAMEETDPVNKADLKKKHKDLEDKDIDNDGDTDDSDEYLHNRRKIVSKAIGEARGRPVAADDADDGNENIIMSLRKAQSLRGMHDVKFENGDKIKVHPMHAQKALSAFNSKRTPADKEAYMKRLSTSHDSFKKAISESFLLLTKEGWR